MAGISVYWSNKLLGVTAGGTGLPSVATLYLALLTTAAVESDTGSTIVEPTSLQYSGYTRLAVTNNTTNWGPPASQIVSNNLTLTPTASAGGASSPVNIVGWALCDAASAGNLIAFAPFGVQPIAIGGGPVFDPGTVVIDLT